MKMGCAKTIWRRPGPCRRSVPAAAAAHFRGRLQVADACVQPAHWSADVDVTADMVVKEKPRTRRSYSGDDGNGGNGFGIHPNCSK